MPQGSLQWQGTQRRTYAPGANWNVQVVRGKVTTRCLWHACKALGIGLLLMILGACMATIGYYADQLSVAQEVRGNLTVRVKNESKGFHLNNLSYAGPIVMGVGGFIVVAACVMTFEARDSAAKVVPARFRFNHQQSQHQQHQLNRGAKTQRSRKSTSSQTSKWDQQLGLFRVNRSPSPSLRDSGSAGGCGGGGTQQRRQLTAEFVQFSKGLQGKGVASPIKKSPSAPSLVPGEKKTSPRGSGKTPKFGGHQGCALLNPELLKRHAVSVDNPSYNPHQMSREHSEHQRFNGSQASMAMDLHLPNKGPVTLKIKDRSDTARRHQLSRQTKIEDAEDLEEARRTAAAIRSYSPKLPENLSSIRYPDDFVPRRKNSIDLRLLQDLPLKEMAMKTSPKDFRKISSPNFRKMSLDKLAAGGGGAGGGAFSDRKSMMGSRKASLEFRRSPDFRRSDYRKYSIERFTADCAKYLVDELQGRAPRASSGENLTLQQQQQLHYHQQQQMQQQQQQQQQQQRGRSRHPKLYHSRSDDNRRRSFDRHRGDSLASRYSLNTQVVIEDRPLDRYELKYFSSTAATSLDTEETYSRGDNNSDGGSSHNNDERVLSASALSDTCDPDALLEEPELENLPDDDDDDDDQGSSAAAESNTAGTTTVVVVDIERHQEDKDEEEQDEEQKPSTSRDGGESTAIDMGEYNVYST